MTDKNFNPTAQFIAGQLPEFVRVDHPTLVAFLTAYYEWLDSDNTYLRSPKKLASVIDVDTTLEEFISYFKNEYLLGFPEKLAVSETTKKPVDPVKLMKNIKGFYRAKGTEKTYDFLFRILFDTSVEFYYPKNDIMKLSDGKWVVRRSIKVSNNIGNAIFDSVGSTVVQRDANGDIIASGRVIEVSTYRVGTNDIAELFLGGVNGQFASGYDGIEFTDKTGVLRRENRVFSVIGKLTITNGGSGYKAGDRVVFTPAEGDTGVKAAARVAEVDASGKIRKILIDNYGVNYKVAPTIRIESEAGTGFIGSVTVSGMAEYQGYYANNDGRLSTNKVIQDNHYYQNFSYVILSEVTIDRYRDVLKRLLNPAGLAFFGKVQIKRCAVADLQNSTSLVEYEVPIIGHYAPYTFKTYDDLSNWFTDPNTGLLAGYDPTVHNQIIRNDLDENGIIDFGDVALAGLEGMGGEEYLNSIGNPVSFNRAFQNPLVPLRTANFQNADPFWIVYQHPNRKIRGSVTARIPYDLKNEFLNDLGAGREFPFGISSSNIGYTGYWAEWTEGSTANRVDWAEGFTSGERYVTLNYNPVKPYTQVYYEPQAPETSSLTTLKSSLTSSKFLPQIYTDNVFTYEGLKNIETITTTNGKSLNAPLDKKNEPTLQTKQASVSNGIVVSDAGQFVSIDETSFSENVPTLSDADLNKGNDTGVQTLNAKSATPVPIAKFNSFTSWDNMYGTLYKTKVRLVPGGPEVETGHRGISGLTNTSWAAMDKFARSLSGDVAMDWNGTSGGAGYRYGDSRYFPGDFGFIAMNTESWDSRLAESIGIADIHDPDSVGNFIINKIFIPQFVGGTGADGKRFPGLRDIYPNINFGNYGHPSQLPNYIPVYTKHGGFSANAQSSKYEELPVTPQTQAVAGGIIGDKYRSYLPSATCPDCRWDGRTVLDTREPESRKVNNTHIISLHSGGNIASRNHAIKLWREKWYNYCRNVQVWMPSFYIATENLQEERSLQALTVSELVKIRKELRDELGYDDKLIIPFISNKYYTVFTGSGGFGPTPPSIQDSSFLTPQEFVDNYIAPSLSGNEKGSVNGFYIWTGDDTYVAKQSLALGLRNPRKVDVKDADGNVVNWQLEPTTMAYGWESYWDFCGGESLRPHAPTGPNVIGSNGKPRVAWLVAGGGYGNNPWWGGNRAPSWPTAQANDGSGCQRLEVNSSLFHFRQNLLAYQAYLDGMTGQTASQYVFDKPHKYGYLKNKFPTWFQPGTDLPDWSRLKGYVFHVRKTSADGNHTLPMSMAPGTTFAFNYRNVKFDTGATGPTNPTGTYRPHRQRDGLGITGDIISNPLFNSLTGSSTIFSYPDGRSYKDRGWNTADRIGYVKSVRDLDATTAEVVVEPFFFVGQPFYTADPRQDSVIWSNVPGYPTGIPSGYPHYGSILVDGITAGVTSGNGVSNIGITGPHTRHCCGATDASNPFGPSSIITMGAQSDPGTFSQRPKFTNLGFPGDIISFGARGATFELVSTSYVTGDFRRSTRGEVDAVFELVDRISQDQIQAAVDYWDNLYNPVRTTDFGFEFNAITNSWFAYGPGDRIIINSWKPEKPGTLNCSDSSVKPNISVVTNDTDATMEITYTYTNTCSVEKDMEWPDVPPLNLGDKVEYYDTRVYGPTGGIGAFREYDRNYPIYSVNYPNVAYSPVHLARTKFEGDCCIDNNFAVSASLMEWRPEVYGNDVSLVVTPPQDYPSVVLAATESVVIRDSEVYDKVAPSETTTTSKWASSWSTPTYNNGPTGSTHITTAFRLTGRVSPNPALDETLSSAASAKTFLDSVPPQKRAIMPFPFNTFAVDDWWRSTGLTLSSTYMTGDACRNSSGNFIEEDINDPRETEGKPYSPAYAGTQRYISPWLDNTTARYKQAWNSWLTGFSAIGGSAQYFILDTDGAENVCSIWSNYMRKEVSDGTSSKMIRHMNYILNDPRADSLTAGNAPTRGSLKQQLKISSGYTAGQFSNFAAQLTVTGAGPEEGLYKLWNSVMMGMGNYYVNEFFSPPIKTLYPSAKITNWDNAIIQRSDYVSESNGHRAYYNMDVGNAVSPHLYGEIGTGSLATVYEIYTPDQKILEYKSGTTKPFGATPWNALLVDQQHLRAVDRNRLAEGKNKSLQPWIASVKNYGYSGMSAFGGDISLHDQYWRENVFHTLLHDPELILYWNTASATPNDDKYMHDTLNDFNNLTNQQVVGTLSSSNERFVYNTEFLVSGCKTNNNNQNLFRVSVNRNLVSIIDLYGEKYQLGSAEVGIWLLTGANCTAIQKSNYDPLSKTLFIRLNTGTPINSRYKAYTDKYGFQFATHSESQMFPSVDPAQSYSSRNSDSGDSTWLSARYIYNTGLSG